MIGVVERFRYLRTHGVGMFCICVYCLSGVLCLHFKVFRQSLTEEVGSLRAFTNDFFVQWQY
jgi:hypothetical protein